MKALIIITVLATIITRGCNNKDTDQQNLLLVDGVYSGTFTLTTPIGISSGDVTIEINGNRFAASGNSNRIPAGGSGTWSLDPDNHIIVFQDENFWTADFDWSLILSGNFIYTFDGNNLVLNRSVGDGSTTQKYELKKN